MNLTMKPQKIHIICHTITIELGSSIMKQVKFNINEFKVFAFSFSSVFIGVFIFFSLSFVSCFWLTLTNLINLSSAAEEIINERKEFNAKSDRKK